jgi:L,D-transpeptidase ErfK/SrfK
MARARKKNQFAQKIPMKKSAVHILSLLIILCSLINSGASGEELFLPITGQMKKHTVQSGEDLNTIGLKYHLAIDHLMLANNLSSWQPKVGMTIIVPTMRIVPAFLDTGLVLNLPERMLYLLDNRKLIARYPVAVGATGKWMTPTGDLKIVNKAKNPVWLPPEWANKEEPVQPGPDNPLGDRWIGLSLPGYGIHATNAPLSIGMATSHGCIRMIPRDAEALFDQVTVGMSVKIIYEPIVIGQAEDRGIIFLAAYPDIYGKIPDMKALLAAKLEKYDIQDIVDMGKAEALVAARKGVAEPILGSDIAILVNNEPVPLSLPPIVKGNKLLVISELLEFLGASTRWDEANKALEIARNDKKVTLTFDSSSNAGDLKPLLWKGRAIVPLRETLEGLGLSFEWNPKNHTIAVIGIQARPKMQSNPGSPVPADGKTYEEKVLKVEEKF